MKGPVPAVDEGRGGLVAAGEFFPVGEVFEKVGCRGLARFDLDGNQVGARINDNIHLVARRITPEIEVRLFSPVQEIFIEFRDDESFEDRASFGPVEDLPGRANLQQIAQKPGVQLPFGFCEYINCAPFR